MASETDFAFDELGNSMENNYETESNNALGTSLMDIYVWEDDDISKSIEVLGTSLIDKLGSSLQEDRSKSHDASDTSVIEEHITFQEDNMTKKDNVDAFRSSITSTKPTDSNSGFLNIQLENPSFTERTKDTFLTMEDDPYDFTIEVENCEDQYIIQDVSRDLFSFKIKPLITSTSIYSKYNIRSFKLLKIIDLDIESIGLEYLYEMCMVDPNSINKISMLVSAMFSNKLFYLFRKLMRKTLLMDTMTLCVGYMLKRDQWNSRTEFI